MDLPTSVEMPYRSDKIEYQYVTFNDKYVQAAARILFENSLDDYMPVGSVVVKNNQIIGGDANGTDYHRLNGCVRVEQKMPTGVGYELCPGCHPNTHSEFRAVQDAIEKGNDPTGADLYMVGHWWCCQNCCIQMEKGGIKRVLMPEDSHIFFNRLLPDNIVGRQWGIVEKIANGEVSDVEEVYEYAKSHTSFSDPVPARFLSS